MRLHKECATEGKKPRDMRRDLGGEIEQPSRYQGEQLKTELMKLRSDHSRIEEWPWQHPFTNIHASALHEAGHAVLAVALGRRLSKLTVLGTVVPRFVTKFEQLELHEREQRSR